MRLAESVGGDRVIRRASQIRGRMVMIAAEKIDLIKFVPISGPGVDALETRKETNNHHKVTAKELRASFESVKDSLFSGLNALLRA
jgi:hypothetical protein